MWNDRYSAAGLSLAGRAVFDPATLTAMTVASMVATAAGGAISASGALSGGAASANATRVGGDISAQATLAGGNYAKTAGDMQQQAKNFEASQLEQNAADEIASSQRAMLDTQDKTRLAISASRARAGASGVNAGVGSPAENEGELAARGSYHALMDLWQGKSNATGLINRAAGARYSGVLDEMGGAEKQRASQLAAAGTLTEAQMKADATESESYYKAAGTLAGTAGSMFKTYGSQGKL